MAIDKSLTKAALETRIGAKLMRKRGFIGPGQARLGWFSLHPSRETWRGVTLADVARRLERSDAYRKARR